MVLYEVVEGLNFPHNSVLRKRLISIIFFLSSPCLSTQFCPTETYTFRFLHYVNHVLSTQFCPTETNFCTLLYGFTLYFPHNSVLRKPILLILIPVIKPTFHTILSYGNLKSRKEILPLTETTFHTILSYGNIPLRG